MKYIKIFLILLLVWPKFWYDRVARKAEEEWRNDGEIPPQYSEKTKKLIKKQKRAKYWAMIMSLLPFGPFSLFTTWIAFRPEKEKTIEYYVSQQFSEIEEFKELRRKRIETIVRYLEEKFKIEDDINWEEVVLPDSEKELQLREFLFGENGLLTKGPEKNKTINDEKTTEELNI